MNKHDRAQQYREQYKAWKNKQREDKASFFPVFSAMMEANLLVKLSGNALRLYLYLGLRSKNETGECWPTIETMARYFGKSKRSISSWLDELEKKSLVTRIQFDQSQSAHTFLLPYGSNTSNNDEEGRENSNAFGSND